jgi:hypothetical protein
MNVTNAQNPFVYLYSTGDPVKGVEPQQSSVNHLPIRPFIGVRAEY